MRIDVLPVGVGVHSDARSHAFLHSDNWNDYWRFQTQYYLSYRDASGELHDIGQVKIGQFGMAEDQSRPAIPESFSRLGSEFFSLGQDDSYYENLNALGDDIRDEILRALRDVALMPELFARSLSEDVMGTSLLRSVNATTVEGQFRRLARGGARLSRYAFVYHPPTGPNDNSYSQPLDFDVVPESEPPTNIHVLIGRNGVGKTHLLNNMARALADDKADLSEVGGFTSEGALANRGLFANVVTVTFSAFDPFEPLSTPRNRAEGMQYTYVGLKRIRTTADDKPLSPKDPVALAREFGLSVRLCLQGARLVRWRRALEVLESDPIFYDAQVASLAESATDDEELRRRARDLFRGLSSGHKIVLLTITRLVESVEEKSLVLLDEPEAHLHPPLLAAFVRALSELLIDRNGVAIIATHSPVVLQEVPRKCVWKLRRSGSSVVPERPETETFGENVGVLTREVFGLEVTRSGYHRLIEEAVRRDRSFERIFSRFEGQVGSEARAMIQALLVALNENGY